MQLGSKESQRNTWYDNFNYRSKEPIISGETVPRILQQNMDKSSVL